MMLIGIRQNVTYRSSSIHIDNYPLEKTNSFKLLGVIFDSNLSFTNHILNLTKEFSYKLAFINRLSKLFPNKVVSKIYAHLIQSHIDYGLPVWGNCGSVNIDKVQKYKIGITYMF